MTTFEERNRQFVARMGADTALRKSTRQWFLQATEYEYSYHFRWMGLPIIQFPQDIVAMQELIWAVQPDLVVETGIARGGSLVFYASMLELLGGDRRVVGVDVDIRQHNREAIEAHPMYKRITMIEGSSVAPETVAQVRSLAEGCQRVLVCLDSNHTHEHVLAELRAYAPLVTCGSYLVVFDTVVEHLPEHLVSERPWGAGNNPMTALQQFLGETDRFEVDTEYDNKLLITVAPGGYLKCVRD